MVDQKKQYEKYDLRSQYMKGLLFTSSYTAVFGFGLLLLFLWMFIGNMERYKDIYFLVTFVVGLLLGPIFVYFRPHTPYPVTRFSPVSYPKRGTPEWERLQIQIRELRDLRWIFFSIIPLFIYASVVLWQNQLLFRIPVLLNPSDWFQRGVGLIVFTILITLLAGSMCYGVQWFFIYRKLHKSRA